MISTGAFFSGRMESPETELNTTHSKEENTDADSSKDCGSERHSNVPHCPAGAQVWTGTPSDITLPGMVPHPLQQPTQPGVVDPLSYRYNVHSFIFTK